MNTHVTAANLKATLAAAKNGRVRAQGAMGLAYLEGTVTVHDFDRGLKWSSLAANQNLATAQCNLANLLAAGNGVEKDPVKAATWYRIAQYNGDEDAAKGL